MSVTLIRLDDSNRMTTFEENEQQIEYGFSESLNVHDTSTRVRTSPSH